MSLFEDSSPLVFVRLTSGAWQRITRTGETHGGVGSFIKRFSRTANTKDWPARHPWAAMRATGTDEMGGGILTLVRGASEFLSDPEVFPIIWLGLAGVALFLLSVRIWMFRQERRRDAKWRHRPPSRRPSSSSDGP